MIFKYTHLMTFLSTENLQKSKMTQLLCGIQQTTLWYILKSLEVQLNWMMASGTLSYILGNEMVNH